MQVLEGLDRGEIARLRAAGEFFWLDLVAPPSAEVHALSELFGVHEMAIEDTLEFRQRPKIDDYGDHVLVVFFGVHDHEPVEVHLYVSGSWLITVRQDGCSALDSARQRVRRDTARTEEEAIYRVLDALTDSFYPVLERVDADIERLEEEMLLKPSEEQRHRIFLLRRELVSLRQVLAPQRDVFAAGGELIARLPGLQRDAAHDYFRDIHDHLVGITQAIDAHRELLTATLDVWLSTASFRMNAVMKQLTLVATIFLPLTFVTGIFGQNFGWLAGHISTWEAFVGYGVGGTIASAALLYWWFRRSGFFDL